MNSAFRNNIVLGCCEIIYNQSYKRINEQKFLLVDEQRKLLGGITDGFKFKGKTYLNTVSYPTNIQLLHKSLHPKAEEFINYSNIIEEEKSLVKRVLTSALNNCHSGGDVRYLLPAIIYKRLPKEWQNQLDSYEQSRDINIYRERFLKHNADYIDLIKMRLALNLVT